MHIHLPYLIFPWSFNEIRLVVSENSRGHEQYPIYSCRTHQRAITLGKIIEPEHAGDMRIHLWYLIFPWSFIEIRQAVSENLRGQERDGRTDARTHGRTDARTKRRLYAPPKFFGEHNKYPRYAFVEKLEKISICILSYLQLWFSHFVILAYEVAYGKTYNKTWATSEDSDQPTHLRSLFSLRWSHVPSTASRQFKRNKWESLPYWVDAQTDLSLCWSHKSYCRFCRWLI